MTREEIIRMSREAGFDSHDMSADFTCNLIDIERLAQAAYAAGAAAEREACAKVCEDDFGNGALNLADAIRARGNT